MPNVWNPFGEFARMRDEMRHMFGETPFLPALSQTLPDRQSMCMKLIRKLSSRRKFPAWNRQT
jgi:hypothetical protein